MCQPRPEETSCEFLLPAHQLFAERLRFLSLCFKRSDERHKFNGGILILQFYRRVLKIKGDLLCLSLVPVIYTYVLLWQMLLLNMAKVVKNEFGLLASMSL